MTEFFERIRLDAESLAPPDMRGRGVVMVGGGRLLPSAYVALSHLRSIGCQAPVQLWHLGPKEIPEFARPLLRRLDVELIDAYRATGAGDFKRLAGWQCKLHALTACPFEDVFLLDADNIPLVDPTVFFETTPFTRSGQLFWPDFLYPLTHTFAIKKAAWIDLGLEPQAGRELESGQLALKRSNCWRELAIARALNADSERCYQRYTWGDKDTFSLAWLITGKPYSTMPHRPRYIDRPRALVFWQHDLEGRPAFQHQRKWLDSPETMRELLLADEYLTDRSLEYLEQFWFSSRAAGQEPGLVELLKEPRPNLRKAAASAASPAELHRAGLDAIRNGDNDAAVAHLTRAVTAAPRDAATRVDLAAALANTSNPGDALPHLICALTLRSNTAEVHNNLGVVFERVGRDEEAVRSFRNAVAIRPDYVQALINLGGAQRRCGDAAGALAAYLAALRIDPDLIGAHQGVVSAAGDLGDAPLVVAALRHLTRLQPNSAAARSSLLYALHYCVNDATVLFKEHLEWQRRFNNIDAVHQAMPHSPSGRIRVGYLSPDFREHTVPRFIGAVLRNHDRQTFEIFCYSDVAECDQMTDWLRADVEHWRDTVGLTDEQLAQIICDDRIDILVDLRGHAVGNRMSMFARRAAPIQVNMVGYFNTTGLTEMDFRITDATQDPPGVTETLHTEALLRFAPTCWCYSPDMQSPPVAPLPAASRGFITFGCMNKLLKISEQCASLWSRVLAAVPGSRLRLAVKSSSSTSAIQGRLAGFGISPERVDLVEKTPLRSDYFRQFNEIDIALDTFPFNGITTTCDGLWMGVPLISLSGNTTVSRAGQSILHVVGLGHLATDSPETYVACAARLAADLIGLDQLRVTMRDRMRHSPLMDHSGYTRALEGEFRRIVNGLASEGVAGPRSTPTIRQ